MFHLFIFEKSTIPARMVSATVDSEADILSNLNINAGDWPSNLVKNLCLLSPDQIELGKMLVEMGQSHLFQQWTDAGVEDDKKKAFFDQVAKLNTRYPGGLASYIKNARELLADSKVGKSPYDGFTPSVPTGEVLSFGDDNFIKYEEAGVKEAQNAAFVLVAGGLGERLGYNGIKVALLAEATTGTCFLQVYIEAILALQEGSCRLTQGTFQKDIPFVIMTSDDTHTRTLEVLESNSYFGMKPTQVKLLKQEKVACLDDNDARLALDPHNKYQIQTKPHGHGDVHSLLYSSGLLKVWLDAGLRWVLFFQDTNGLLFKAIPASLGVSATNQYQVNSLAVQRKAKEAMGGITRLTHSDGRSMVINVEYNQLDPLLRAAGHPDGDADCETGYSPFPGNINHLILELGPYIEELTKTGGAIKEFVNPKYKDASKTSFKSSTRLECMMQDYPKTLPPTARVGFTVMDKWLAYAPVKNNPEDASKVPKGNPYHSATSGEMAIYRANSLILVKAGVQVEGPVQQVFNGQEVEVWPRITWKPKWGLTFSEIKSKVRQSCSVSQRSTMVLKGRNIFLEDLSLDGALIINSIDGAEVKVEGSIQNKGWLLERIHYKDSSSPEELRIRGFKINKLEHLEQTYSETGKFILKPQC
ncbi:UDP-sugar pyrophosphorylase [Gossypium hirsutum]|uniref:UTP-monosaccharide-1-phosphate uridylyltransferase n=1 Tax=Gossypium hirsutum TaxID=3635 RepID=A0ABM2ZJM0_GOSHI|nr:UDP-sugar pyrophosphorylase-like [Gossypium hirsutum]